MSLFVSLSRRLRQRVRPLLISGNADRLLLFVPLFSLVLFLGAAAALVRYTQQTELQREHDTLQRDTEWARQRMSLEMALMQEQLQSMANALETRRGNDRFPVLAHGFLQQHAPAMVVYATDATGQLSHLVVSPAVPRDMRWVDADHRSTQIESQRLQQLAQRQM
ncbi:hypothetical protein, partial [Metallibacterium scheffleri]|uniref:hypothetical protein n=1 Tax=Metallibacterium scheffleri TaxID=993689 RepID=UPI0026EA198C